MVEEILREGRSFDLSKKTMFESLNEFTNTIRWISFFVLFFCFYCFVRNVHLEEIAHSIKLIGIFFGLIALILILKFSNNFIPLQRKYSIIGNLTLSEKGIVFRNDMMEEKVYKMSDIERIDLYYYRGIQQQESGSENSFKSIQCIRLRMLADEELENFYVLNYNQGFTRLGSFYDAIQELRESDIDIHRKIQFWNKW